MLVQCQREDRVWVQAQPVVRSSPETGCRLGLFGRLTEALSVFTGKMHLDTQTHRFVSHFTLATDLGTLCTPALGTGAQRRPCHVWKTGDRGCMAGWLSPRLTLWLFSQLPDGHTGIFRGRRALSPFLLPRGESGGRGLLCAWSLFS